MMADKLGDLGVRLSADQLGSLAEQLPDASPLRARRLEDQIVAGFYGRDEMRLVDAFRFSEVADKLIIGVGAVLRPFDVAAVFRSGGTYVLVAKATGQRDRYYRVESVRGRWGFWGGVLMLSEEHKRQIPSSFFPIEAGDEMVQLANSAPSGRRFIDFSTATLPELVESIFPDRVYAARWMRRACPELGDRVPRRLAKTRKGRAELKAFLIGVGSGNFMAGPVRFTKRFLNSIRIKDPKFSV